MSAITALDTLVEEHGFSYVLNLLAMLALKRAFPKTIDNCENSDAHYLARMLSLLADDAKKLD